MSNLLDRISALERTVKSKAIQPIPDTDLATAVRVISKRMDFDARMAIGSRVLAGALTGDDLSTIAELDACCRSRFYRPALMRLRGLALKLLSDGNCARHD